MWLRDTFSDTCQSSYVSKSHRSCVSTHCAQRHNAYRWVTTPNDHYCAVSKRHLETSLYQINTDRRTLLSVFCRRLYSFLHSLCPTMDSIFDSSFLDPIFQLPPLSFNGFDLNTLTSFPSFSTGGLQTFPSTKPIAHCSSGTVPCAEPEAVSVAKMSFKCSTCWDDELDLNKVIACSDHHVTCVDCAKRGTESAISDNKVFVCPAKDSLGKPCGKAFPNTAMSRALSDKLKESHDMVESQIVFAQTIETFAEDDVVVKCPLCAGVLLLSKETADCIGYHDATKIKCRFCQHHYCKKCNKQWHDGPCDPQARADEELVQKLAIVCLCGNRFIRGDGCNRIKCNRCSRSWCWICKHYFKPSEQSYTEHYWQPTDRYHDIDKCPLYGERAENQVFAKPPEPPRKSGRGIAAAPVEPQNADLAAVRAPVQAVQVVPAQVQVVGPVQQRPEIVVIQNRVKTGRVTKKTPATKPVNTICGALTNRGTQCQRLGKNNGMCGIHARMEQQK